MAGNPLTANEMREGATAAGTLRDGARWVLSGSEKNLRFLGGLGVFMVRVLIAVPMAATKYLAEVRRQVAELTLGKGFLITLTGTLGVILVESVFVGISVGIEGFEALNMLGVAPITGFISAYGNTREIAPLIAAVAIAAQIGCKFTAQLGTQRISEEIDALESMGIPSLPYLISTRLVATYIAVIPLYLVGLFGAYAATRLTVGIFYQQALGTYDHYFNLFLNPVDVLYSVVKVLVFTAFIVVVHTYYGYTASGGPEGVGIAAARAIRVTIVLIACSNVLMTMQFWGLQGIRLSGG